LLWRKWLPKCRCEGNLESLVTVQEILDLLGYLEELFSLDVLYDVLECFEGLCIGDHCCSRA